VIFERCSLGWRLDVGFAWLLIDPPLRSSYISTPYTYSLIREIKDWTGGSTDSETAIGPRLRSSGRIAARQRKAERLVFPRRGERRGRSVSPASRKGPKRTVPFSVYAATV
jgi:hypothetical protein